MRAGTICLLGPFYFAGKEREMERVRVCEGCEGSRGRASLSWPLVTREERGREREPRLAPSVGGRLVSMEERV